MDVTYQGRFWDAFEQRDGRWLLVFRQPIYELDQMRPVDHPSPRLILDEERLASYPEGRRHLAYLQLGWDSMSAGPCQALAAPKSKALGLD